MSLLSFEQVSFAYENTTVLSDITFTVNASDFLCILGENGAGKSTLMKGILGLKKPSSGTITFGDDIRSKEIGYLPQQTQVQKDFPASVFEVVLSGCLNRLGFRLFYSKTEKETALANMEKLHIADLKDHCYRELSGGQQQRVLLARALCAGGQLLLLDEPVTGLDPKVSLEFYELMKELNEKEHRTILMISHDLDGAISSATHILHLGKKQLFFGSVKDYKNSSAAQRFYRKEIALC